MTADAAALRRSWAALAPRLSLLEPLAFDAGQWALVAALRADFTAPAAHGLLPMPIARVRPDAEAAILDAARALDHVQTVAGEGALPPGHRFAPLAAAFDRDCDALMAVLLPRARYRKGHHAVGLFTAPEPHGLHTDHSAEDPAAGAEPLCLARIGALATHYLAGDERMRDAATRRRLDALRYWTLLPEEGPEGEPEAILVRLLREGVLRSIPLGQVMLLVGGNGGGGAQPTQHIAARPPEAGAHSALFQRHYRLVAAGGQESIP